MGNFFEWSSKGGREFLLDHFKISAKLLITKIYRAMGVVVIVVIDVVLSAVVDFAAVI